ncbi:Ras GTPase [Orbilia ellipsospora]|uniref:Ras GTPase n=1 Tax=Orbilia ellipsospora TaxID=2528407 RepID=A0AAV9XN41_9PEZI
MGDPENRKSRREYKVSVFGDGGVGKSCLAIQYSQSIYNDDYDPTMEDSHRKQTVVDNDTALMDILDTAAQEELEHEASTYHRTRGKDGFMLVYSIANKKSFEKITELHQLILRQTEKKSAPIVLVGNKTDLDSERQVTFEEGHALAETLGGKFLETSAKNRVNVDECFTELIREIRRCDPGYQAPEPPKKAGLCASCAIM